ncbi:MAG: hypothetical protein EA390_02735 [Balneolaceae bacterium]|nr:MAG: hypothetical protein EA390_02735 [Balneolaceae bacterium]
MDTGIKHLRQIFRSAGKRESPFFLNKTVPGNYRLIAEVITFIAPNLLFRRFFHPIKKLKRI